MCIVCSGGAPHRSPVTQDRAALQGNSRQPQPPAPRSAPGLRLTPEQLAAGEELLRQVPSVDVHSHPARFFLKGLAPYTPFGAALPPLSLETAAQEMRRGGVSTVLFAAVADYPLLDTWESGLRAVREFRQGEAIAEYQRQLRVLQKLVRDEVLPQARGALDIDRAHADRQAACMFCVEGGDFIEDHLERIAQSYEQGVRSITLIHYHTNQIGDTQTESPSHGGLTPVGREIIREMQQVGVIVDLSHASFEATRHAAEVSTRPMLISHTNLHTSSSDHPRLISVEHARLVTHAGGVVGAVAAGFDQGSLGDYVDTILRMVDLLGIEHVAIGTDLDFTYEPVFTSYLDWHTLPAGLLARGMHREEVANVMGGNFLRVLRANSPPQKVPRSHEL